MSGEQIVGAVVFFITVSGALWTIWWRIEGRVSEAKREATLKADAAGTKADLVSAQLADHKLHVAETYVSKQGHRESTDQILDAINRVNERLDRAFEPKRRTGA